MPDGMHLSNTVAGLSTVPDAMYVLYTTFQTGRVQRVPNANQVGVVELEGCPDMVLEVVSDSSVEKDTQLLPPLYQRAGIAEFWRIDARAVVQFEILRLTPAGYAPTHLPDGWWHSDVFGQDFHLDQDTDPIGQPRFTLRFR